MDVGLTDSIITRQGADHSGITWRFLDVPELPFDPVIFDEERLRQQGLVNGQAGAGRGNTHFLRWHDQELVLRHYHRGGLVQRISRQHYLFTGIERTRAMREFDMLVYLQQKKLPVSPPFACQVIRSGLRYRASLVTRRLPGQTLAEYLVSEHKAELQPLIWQTLGELIGRLHALGVCHADLNAHNLMIDADADADARVFVIDFDRASHRRLPPAPAESGWCRENIERLQRSLRKLTIDSDFPEQGFALLETGWKQALQQ